MCKSGLVGSLSISTCTDVMNDPRIKFSLANPYPCYSISNGLVHYREFSCESDRFLLKPTIDFAPLPTPLLLVTTNGVTQ